MKKPRVRAAALAISFAAVMGAVALMAREAAHLAAPAPPVRPPGTHRARPAVLPWPRVTVAAAGRLPASASGAALAQDSRGGLYQVGGFDGRTFASAVYELRPAVRTYARLPVALHDAAAGFLGGRLYVFGGGQSQSLNTVSAVRAGGSSVAGHMNRPLSDAVCLPFVLHRVRGLLLIGGYDGSAFHMEVPFISASGGRLRWRAAFRLPVGLRYASVARAGSTVYIAGGLRTTGAASRAVWAWRSPGGRPARIARLPHGLYQASAWSVPGYLLLAGGLNGAGTPERAIYAVNVRTGRVRRVGRLPYALADMGYSANARGAWLAGGIAGRAQAVSNAIFRVYTTWYS